MKKFLTLTLLSLSTLLIFLSNSSTPNNGNTGAPAEGKCTSCHSGGTGTTTVSYTMNTSTPNQYKNDSVYTGTVSVNNSSYTLGTNRWGFEITARDSNNNKIGTFTVTNGTTTILSTGTKDYMKHKNANINVGTKVWSFSYTAPSTATYNGTITFYVAGLACDGTGGTGGDMLKCDSFKFTRFTPTPDINVKQGTTTYLNNSTYNYGNTFKNTNNDKVFTIENTGAATLNTNSFNITGTHASMFTIVGGTPTSINAGSSSNITVRFTPNAVAGLKTANLVIGSNDPDENPYTITLNGTATVNPPMAQVKQNNNIINSNGSFNYGLKTVGTNNDTIFKLYNLGDSVLTFTGLPSITGVNVADFTVTTLPPLSINPGDSASVTIRFAPGASGPRTANISIPNNDPTKNPYVVTLNGSGTTTGLAPEINMKQGSNTILTGGNFDYGGIKVSTFIDTIFTIENIGTDTLKFTNAVVTGTNASQFIIQTVPSSNILKNTTAQIKVRFAPTSMGSKTAKLSIFTNDADENPYDINLAGVGLAPENDVFNGTTAIPHTGNYAYGNVGVNKPASAVFTVRNTGNDTLHMSNTTIVGTDASMFSITTSTTANIPPSGTFNVIVQFNPTSIGAKNAALNIASDDANENPYTINLSGIGTAPENDVFVGSTAIPSTGNYSFGNVPIGGSKSVNFLIKNTGTDTLKISNATFTGADAAICSFQTPTNAIILPSLSYVLTVKIAPAAVGPISAKLNILSDDSDENPYEINLSGTAIVSPDINAKVNGNSIVNNGNVSYPSVMVGNFVDTNIVIENAGGDTLRLSSYTITGAGASAYAIVSTTALQIPSGNSFNLTIRYAPGGAGTLNAALNILSNDPDENPYVINLSGTATPAPAPDINVKENGNQISNNNNFSFTAIPATNTTDVQFTLENTGTQMLSAIKLSITGADANEFAIVSNPVTSIVGGGNSKFTIRFAPITQGAKTANLIINSNDPDENPYTVILNGVAGSVPDPQIDVKVNNNSVDTNGNYEFPATRINLSNSVSFKIFNVGLGLLKNISAAITGDNASDFEIDIVPAIQIGTGSNTEVKVKFTPSAVGIRKATLTIYSNDVVKDTFVIFLTGNGTSAIHQAMPASVSVLQSEEMVQVKWNDNKPFEVMVSDMNGKLIYQKTASNHSEVTCMLPQKGIYLLAIKDIETGDLYLRKIQY